MEVRRRRRDWRWGVGLAGRSLITLGVLLLLFVAYMLWGTGIQHAQSQDALDKQFSAELATTTTVPTTLPPATTATVPSSSAPVTTTTPPTTTTAPAPVPPVYVDGDPIARLEIPRIGVNEIVVEGVGVSDLKKGPGHYTGTPLPGQPGNAAIAGHRTTYGGPFEDVDQLQPGDGITLTTSAGHYVYRVTGHEIVLPSDVSVIANTPDNRLTLTSCYPKRSAAKRIIVTAAFDPASSSPLAGTGAPATTTPTTAPATTAPPVTSAPSDTTVGTTTPTTAATTAAPPTTSLNGTQQLAVESAFNQGWFSDPAAWPHVLFWGGVVAGVAGAAWYLGRRTHGWVGWVAGAAPFLVVLYFFFENVSRLLPPNL